MISSKDFETYSVLVEVDDEDWIPSVAEGVRFEREPFFDVDCEGAFVGELDLFEPFRRAVVLRGSPA
jgi:hypothetical protein